MIGAILLVVAAALGLVLVLAARKPDVFRVRRAITIAAPPEKIYPYLDDFHRWVLWSPYEAKDPAMERTHSGAASGKGARYEWRGNKQVGSGRMEVVQSDAPRQLRMDLHFLTPFENRCDAIFTLAPQGDTTQLVWELQGPAPFMSRLMQVFMDMDQLVGRDFEVGLANLKRLVEQ